MDVEFRNDLQFLLLRVKILVGPILLDDPRTELLPCR
jgi:hypothetical protein